jgi:UDP-glucose 4-epimerase
MMNSARITKAFVTGGAGFIGSHIVDRLVQDGAEVTVFDNFSTGREEFLSQHAGNCKVKVVHADVLDRQALTEEIAACDFVFHLQANADVRNGIRRTRVDLEQNTIATWNVLEAMRIKEIKRIAFASSAAVDGEPDVFPTPESYAPLQTSLYGASKIAGEAMIQAYTEYFDMTCYIFRFVSWIGERYSHGVIFDFVKKLSTNPDVLESWETGSNVSRTLTSSMAPTACFTRLSTLKNARTFSILATVSL